MINLEGNRRKNPSRLRSGQYREEKETNITLTDTGKGMIDENLPVLHKQI